MDVLDGITVVMADGTLDPTNVLEQARREIIVLRDEIETTAKGARRLWLTLPVKEGDVFEEAIKEITRLRALLDRP